MTEFQHGALLQWSSVFEAERIGTSSDSNWASGEAAAHLSSFSMTEVASCSCCASVMPCVACSRLPGGSRGWVSAPEAPEMRCCRIWGLSSWAHCAKP